jgi:hypothetical protein
MVRFSTGSSHMSILRLKVNSNCLSYSEHAVKFLICSLHCRFIGLKWIETGLRENSFGFLNKAQLMKLRLKAVRAGVWFRTLPRINKL